MMQKKSFPIWVLVWGLIFPSQGLAWNITAHEVIAQIAYDNLTPRAKQRVDKLYPVLQGYYPAIQSFITMAAWPDWIKADDVTAFNNWHFINQPLHMHQARAPRHIRTPNVVWAIGQSLQVVNSSHANVFEQSMFLAFLSHFVGDVHQPLHCANLYSLQFIHGDRGGNLFNINSPIANNLHSLWDSGLGLFNQNLQPPASDIKRVAKKLEQQYPPSYFGEQINNLSPQLWAQESYVLARDVVYQIQPGSMPSAQYINQGQTLAAQRLTLAGYRLAALLNQ